MGGVPIKGIAPETVIVLTLTLSATTTENITLLVGREVVKIKLVKFAVKEDITGPDVSDLFIVIVLVELEVLPKLSVADKV